MLIDYENVNVYQEDNKILEDVNFHVDEGEFIYIIGKVGSGKSSLLKTLYCELDLDDEEESKANVLGRDVKTLRRKEVPDLRREIGIIFQDFQLLHDRTIRKNLRFVLRATGWDDNEKIQQRIEEVLTEVGMLDKIDRMPHELSGGEQQRIAIARAILNQPKLIIADEPTGNLDPETAFNIVKLLKDVTNTGTAVVMTTHNIPLLDQFPGIVYRCRDGHIKDVTNEYNHMDLAEDAGTTSGMANAVSTEQEVVATDTEAITESQKSQNDIKPETEAVASNVETKVETEAPKETETPKKTETPKAKVATPKRKVTSAKSSAKAASNAHTDTTAPLKFVEKKPTTAEEERPSTIEATIDFVDDDEEENKNN